MNYKIVPISFTQPDWKTFIEVCQEHLGYSPTRGLDNQEIQMGDPSSFLACLAFDNEPLKNLANGVFSNYTFRHVMFSFLAVLDKRAVDALYYHLDLEIHCKANEEGEFVTIISANMSQWYHAILKGCNHSVPKDARRVMNKCLQFFRQTGYRTLWESCDETMLDDKTFILRKR